MLGMSGNLVRFINHIIHLNKIKGKKNNTKQKEKNISDRHSVACGVLAKSTE